MALTPRLSTAAANAAANAACALCNGGFFDVYDGTQPATADTAVGSQVKLAHLAFSATAFGAAVAAVATANAITAATAVASSTATWFRAYKADGTSPVFDGSVGTSGANLNLSSVAIVTGGTVTVTSLTYTQAQS